MRQGEKMKKDEKKYKAIFFDLSSEKLRNLFGESGRKYAYRKIGAFMKSKGFTHRQWSGYFSKNKLVSADIIKLNYELFEKFPWLNECANKIDVTDIGKKFDMIKLHKEMEKDNNYSFEMEKNGSNTMSFEELKNNINSRSSKVQNREPQSKDKGKHNEEER